MMLMLKTLTTTMLATGLTVACSTATFTGTTPSKATGNAPVPATPAPTPAPTAQPTDTPTTNQTPTPSAPPSTQSPQPSPTTPSVPCQAGQQSIGAQVAFLIDNSNSNSETDCPSPTATGTFNGATLYTCGGQTNREQAVLAAYDLLAKITANEPANGLAKSDIAIASFPTSQDYVSGWAQDSQGWIGTDANGRAAVQNAMQFARKPSGMTPYGAAMSAASELFKSATTDGRAKVAVLVTDGDPTDRDPSGVQAQASQLKQAGVDVIVITYNATHASRMAEHTAMMQRIDASQAPSHWYASKYSSFSAYMSALIGTDAQGTGGLAQVITTSGQVIEVGNSAVLTAAFQQIIQTKAIACQQ